jgi:hypothetical protein
MRLLNFFIGVVFYFFCTIASAGTIDPNTSDNHYIEYGKQFPCVVSIKCLDDQKRMCYGSAVIIDKNWIVTAAHILKDTTEHTIELDNNKKYKLFYSIYHPEYLSEKFGNADIGLGYIEEDIVLNFYPDLYDKKDEVGKVCSIVGFGQTGDFIKGASLSDKQKRGGSNIIDYIQDNILVCSPSRPGQSMTELEFLISNGDSGGGLFIEQKLAGINSGVMCKDHTLNSNYGDEGCHTRISSYKFWIKNTINNYLKNKNEKK